MKTVCVCINYYTIQHTFCFGASFKDCRTLLVKERARKRCLNSALKQWVARLQQLRKIINSQITKGTPNLRTNFIKETLKSLHLCLMIYQAWGDYMIKPINCNYNYIVHLQIQICSIKLQAHCLIKYCTYRI